MLIDKRHRVRTVYKEALLPQDEMNHISSVKIVEIFDSFQGEGLNAGVPTRFIRLSFCNLRCYFCDTPFNEVNRIYYDEDSLYRDILNGLGNKLIVFTGGEPLLALKQSTILKKVIVSLLNQQRVRKICFETNGMFPLDNDLLSFKNMHLTVSPKLNISKNLNSFRLIHNFESLIEGSSITIELKFIADIKRTYTVELDRLIRDFTYLGKFNNLIIWINPVNDVLTLNPKAHDFTKSLFSELILLFPNLDIRIGTQLHKIYNVQ